MQISENPKPIPADIREKLENYRTQLLSAGFFEPTRHHSADWHWYFYRPDTDLTAFAVNLRGRDGWLEVTYGLASTAFTRMAGDENALAFYGLSDPDITLRENFLVCDDSDAETLAAQIAGFFSRYRGTEKDALLDLAKEKRKQPTLQMEHILAFLNYLRDLPGTDKVKRKTLITIFVNSVYLYDDYFTIIFNAGNATLRAENIPRKSIENSLKQAVNKTSSGSGAVNCIPPKRRAIQSDGSSFWYGVYDEGGPFISL